MPVLFLLMMAVVLVTMRAVCGERTGSDKAHHNGHQQKSH